MRKIRLFWVWQSDQEAAFLTQLAHQGWRLTRRRGLVYHFAAETPLAGRVALDYQPKAALPEYEALMADAGWTLWQRSPAFGGSWLYWYHPDQAARIYSDAASQIDLLQRMRRVWTGFGALMLVLEAYFLIVLLNTAPTPLRVGFLVGCIVVLAGLYGYNAWALTRRIQRLAARAS
ncbi:DUF2812 domain-containing protein [Lacticaseibacillus daqingensis]|uniref:DUF2812 domain-containing protein n=1 Tax=Lacticaseibacillus daqingensis TaxID=2486014 RepID=UPI0013DE121F|nr:DUF2812 domain-containing protein [Lacticaseibacillus daqingensis]